MKVKITYPTGELQAGLTYDLPADEAREIIRLDHGFAVETEAEEQPKPKPRKAKKEGDA